MIRDTRWYGLTARTPQEYFYNNCHSYSDISDVVDRKGTRVLKDLTPTIESFISNCGEIVPSDFMEKMMKINDPYSLSIAKESIVYDIDHLSDIETPAKDIWPVWLNIPEIERMHRLSKVSESAKEILDTSLVSFADRVASNLSTMDTEEINRALESFAKNVDYTKMIYWQDCRESVMKKSPKAAYIGDLIADVTEEDWPELVFESAMPEIDMMLQGVAKRMCKRDTRTAYTVESFRNIVDDMWGHFAALEASDNIDDEVHAFYTDKKMTVSPVAYGYALAEMAKDGCLPSSVSDAVEKAGLSIVESRRIKEKHSDKVGSVTESFVAMEIPSVLECGKLFVDDDDMRFLNSTNEMFFSEATEADNAASSKFQEGASKIKKVAQDIDRGTKRGRAKIHSMFKFFKDNEEVVDQKLTKMTKKFTHWFSGSPEEIRRDLVEGKGNSVMSMLKKMLSGYAVFCFSKVGFLVMCIVKWTNRGKLKRAEKSKILMELEGELNLVDEKIRDAQAAGDKDAKYALMRTRNEIEMGIKRIKQSNEAIQNAGGVGAGSVLIKK